jgi:type I restriction enzyme S subunit
MSNATSHIETEKQRVPAMRFNEFDGVWAPFALKDITPIDEKYGIVDGPFGSNLKTIHYKEEGVPIITSGYVTNGYFYAKKYLFVTPEKFLKEKRSAVRAGDIVMAKIGARCGASAILPKNHETSILSGNALKITVDASRFSTMIIWQQLWHLYSTHKIDLLKTVGAQPAISIANLKKFKIVVPNLPEQQKIASFLAAVDEKIQQLTKKAALLEQYKKGVMQQLFSGQLRFKDPEGNPYPDWDWVGGNELFDNISDKKHNSDLPILAITQDQGAIPRELINYKMTVTEASVASYKVVQKGDFIISLRTFQGGIEFSDYHGICSPAYNILRPSSENVDRAFYRFYLKTSFYIRQLQKNLEGIRDGKMISYKYFSEIKVPFPSKLEQQKIARYLSGIDTKIESVNNQITQTQTFKKGLLQQLFV